ncbi:prepilin-type N-terminal cleavage/methylation domain-containing protein [Zunongwangia sp.]|uniref:prepilin-type N-terminal cleavage/methylation domain-containing protein n=1 Tax=Zunongwangia sp. TaxID=1965325 RepID=UPI003AA842DB
MHSKKKIAAFTLVEMVVVLIIASIIIALSFSVLNLVRKNLSKIEQQYIKETNRLLFQAALEADFSKYDQSLLVFDRKLVFRNRLDSVTYTFIENRVIRNKDTLNFKIQKADFLFKGDTITNGYFDAVGVFQENTSEKVFCYRINDAKTYLNEN